MYISSYFFSFMSMEVFMTCPPVMALIFPFSHKKYRRMGEAAWPEVPIAFCMIYFFQGMRRTR